jgi:molybdate transport system permease protein
VARVNWFPLWNSLRIAAISTGITFFLGLFAAQRITSAPRWLKGALDTILTLPLVLPPTVIGFFILTLMGPKGPVGSLVRAWFGWTITMRWQAAVVAVTIVTFPLMYRTVRGAFDAFDERLIQAGRTLGLTDAFLFWRVKLPGCRDGILAGVVLSFARGLGEYGATSMVAGYIANRTATISTSVAYFWQIGQDGAAYFWVAVNLVISLTVMTAVNLLEKRRAS